MFLSSDHLTYRCIPLFAAYSLSKKYSFAKNVNQRQPIKKPLNPETLKRVTFK